MTDRDPLERRASESRDLYDLAHWERRTALDRLSALLHRIVLAIVRWGTILVALLITAGVVQLSLDRIQAASIPVVGLLTVCSAIPALALVAWVYRSDVTVSEPIDVLAATFVLGVLFAGFAVVLESPFTAFGQGLFGQILLFFLVVGPIEEGVKLLAVRVYAYRQPAFSAVIDGAVYGAVAGLGFATIENALYIGVDFVQLPASSPLRTVSAGTDIAATRAIAGPGHVIYSAFAGYYLGLAKFNPKHAGPIIVKGLVIASVIHATYNTLVGVFVGIVHGLYPNVPLLIPQFSFVVLYLGVFGLLLFRKLNRYRETYNQLETEGIDSSELPVEQTEFDDPVNH